MNVTFKFKGANDSIVSLEKDLATGKIFPSPTRPAPPMPTCKPPRKSAEEMLKKALEYANEEMAFSTLYDSDDYFIGKRYAFGEMITILEMLIKEAKQNG